MRNALLLLCVISALTLCCLHEARASDLLTANAGSAYAPSKDSLNLDQQLLPIHGSDLPLPTANANGITAAGPQESVVEAIPTPTAFQTGGLLLAAIIAVRFFRKLPSKLLTK